MTDATADAIPAAVLFDCDGTLLDSETVTVASMRTALATLGHELTRDHVAQLVGHPWPHTRARLVDWFGLGDGDLATYRRRMRAAAVPLLEDPRLVFDDVVAVLDELQRRDVPLAVVTSSGRRHLDRVLGLAPLRDRFAVRVAREDVQRHKPDPLPYRTALDALRRVTDRPLPTEHVVVVEDSAAGVAAGRALGCHTVAVDRGAGLHDLGGADRVVSRLDLTALAPPVA